MCMELGAIAFVWTPVNGVLIASFRLAISYVQTGKDMRWKSRCSLSARRRGMFVDASRLQWLYVKRM